MRRLLTTSLFIGVLVSMVLPGGAVIAAERKTSHENPWDQVIYGSKGEVLAAHGRDASGQHLALTVATVEIGSRLIATTTYVRGKDGLRIERTYDPILGLEVTYSSGAERLLLTVRPETESGERSAVYTFPDGRVFPVVVNAGGRILQGEIHALREAMDAPGRIQALYRQYRKDADRLDGPIPEAGRPFMWKVPDAWCLDECALGCADQCRWECLSLLACGICKEACMMGCFIGCAS